MQLLKLPLCIGLLLQQGWLLVTAASASVRPTAHSIVFQTESTPSSSVIQAADIRVRRGSAKSPSSSSLFRQKRQYRCEACYEDRRRHGQHSGSTADDGNWYQPRIRNYNRYRELSLGGERDYERFDSYYDYNRDRNNDYIPRTYDRYEEPRYDDRIGSYPDRGQRRYYGHETRTPSYFGPDRYTDVKTSDKFDVPVYERNYGNRYDLRNYRPRDETYRGQSGLDSSGHGYYFSSNEESRLGWDTSSHGQPAIREPSLRPYGRPVGNPCRVQESKCPYDENFASSGSLPSTAAASYQTVHSGGHRGSGSSVSSTHKDGSGWSYLDEKESGDGEIDRDGSTEGNTQSSPYSRPRRPLDGSYPFDRERNVVLGAGTGDDARVGAKPQVEKNALKNTA